MIFWTVLNKVEKFNWKTKHIIFQHYYKHKASVDLLGTWFHIQHLTYIDTKHVSRLHYTSPSCYITSGLPTTFSLNWQIDGLKSEGFVKSGQESRKIIGYFRFL